MISLLKILSEIKITSPKRKLELITVSHDKDTFVINDLKNEYYKYHVWSALHINPPYYHTWTHPNSESYFKLKSYLDQNKIPYREEYNKYNRLTTFYFKPEDIKIIGDDLDEIKITSGVVKPEKGKLYDLKTWWAPGEFDDTETSYNEPYPGTKNGEEGWYWSKEWEFIKIENGEAIFEDNIEPIQPSRIKIPIKDLKLSNVRPTKNLDEIKINPKITENIIHDLIHKIWTTKKIHNNITLYEKLEAILNQYNWSIEDTSSTLSKEQLISLYQDLMNFNSINEIKITANITPEMIRKLMSNRYYSHSNEIIEKYGYYDSSSPDLNHWLKTLDNKTLKLLYNNISSLNKIDPLQP